MQSVKFFAVALASLILLNSESSTLAAQENTFLLDLPCVDIDGKKSNDFEATRNYFSVNREFFNAVMRAYPGAGMTCKLPDIQDSSLLQLQFGIHDANADSNPITVKVYLDGQIFSSETVVPGEVRNLLLGTSTAKSFAIEVSCTGSNCNNWLYFSQGQLEEAREEEKN